MSPSLKALAPLLLALAACGGGETLSTVGLERPPPDEPATGSVVASLTSEDTSFALHDEGDGCLALTIGYAGLQRTVERSCFSGERVLAASDSCGWLEVQTSEDTATECDVMLQTVLYGAVADPAIAHVCIGTIEDPRGVTSARFVPVTRAGFILDEARPNEAPVAHLFLANGVRYGHPPLDARSDAIYRLCEQQAAWGAGEEYLMRLDLDLAEALQDDMWIVSVDAGAGAVSISGGLFIGESDVFITLRASDRSDGLRIEVRMVDEEAPVFEHVYPWPSFVEDVLAGRETCDAIFMETTIEDGLPESVVGVATLGGARCG